MAIGLENNMISDGYISYIFYGDRYNYPINTEDCSYPNGTVFTIIDGEVRIVKNEMPPNAKIPNYGSGIFNQSLV